MQERRPTQEVVDCRCKCYCKLTQIERTKIFQQFNDQQSHDLQNAYLRSCVTAVPKPQQRRRPRQGESYERNTYIYRVNVGSKSGQVCKASFVALPGFKESWLQRKVLNFDSHIADGRGRHSKHSMLDEDIKRRVGEHIKKFSARKSHYSRSKNKYKKYFDSSLNVAKMHQLFILKNQDLKTLCKYFMYHEIINHEFNISCDYPRSDICDLYEKKKTGRNYSRHTCW